MATIILTLPIPEELHELLVAELSDLDFDAFEQDGSKLIAYGPASRWNDVSRQQIETWLHMQGLEPVFQEEVAPEVNWNARWEASIEPIAVGPFLIKPSWHEVPEEHAGREVLEIDPKMSFGTGYHPSTRLALRFLLGVIESGDRVLDAGCGTGILALAALRLGASRAIGFDIDPWAGVNADENAARNGLADRLEVREGSIEIIPENDFDVILANINRNALISLLPEFVARMKSEGRLVMAGLLRMDREDMLAVAERVELALQDEASEEEWWSGVWRLANQA